MIETIVLNNFQSHKKTVLKFHPNVNAIVGVSNHGKSSIIRGLHWVRYNRPSGQQFVSHWNQDKKGNPIDATSVKIKINGNIIQRVRQKDFNGYEVKLGDKQQNPFEAIGMDVPEEIEKLFNISEVNLQSQMDAPFLLSASASDVARFLNKEIRLDIIDRILGNIEHKRRQVNSDIDYTATTIKTIQDKIESFAWLETADEFIIRGNKIEERLSDNKTKKMNLSEMIESVEEQISVLKTFSNIEKIKEYVHAYKTQLADKQTNDSMFENLNELIGDITACNKVLAKYKKINIEHVEDTLMQIEAIKKRLDEKKEIKENLNQLVTAIHCNDDSINTFSHDLLEIKKQMPTLCPLCGAEIKDDICG